MIHVKIIQSYRTIVAVSDSELLGKKFEEGKFQLDVKESFYKSEKNYEENEAVEIIQDMIREDATFNIVGEKAILASIKAGLISENEIRKIAGIPYSLVLL